MTTKLRLRSFGSVSLFSSVLFLQFLTGLAGGSTGSKAAAASATANSGAGLKVLFIVLGVTGFLGLCVFLFKLWQRKKREEQHARLLRLFEEDDDLELELGLRD